MAVLISVIVPVYNRREYLAQCVDSLLCQSLRGIEIMLIDNASTDGAGEMCDEYARRDPRVFAHHMKENVGASGARNFGMERASGAFIGFVDCDDWIEPDMMERLYGLIERTGADMAACGMEESWPDGDVKRPCKPAAKTVLNAREAFVCMLKGDHFGGWPCNKLYRAAAINAPPAVRMPEDVTVAEDMLFNATLFSRGATIAYQPWPLYHYRIHAQSAVRTFRKSRRTIFAAWRRAVELAARFDAETELYAKAMYSQMAAITRARALLRHNRTEARYARAEIGRYGNALLRCPGVSRKTKIRFVLTVLFPVASDKLWGFLRKRFKLRWTAGEA